MKFMDYLWHSGRHYTEQFDSQGIYRRWVLPGIKSAGRNASVRAGIGCEGRRGLPERIEIRMKKYIMALDAGTTSNGVSCLMKRAG